MFLNNTAKVLEKYDSFGYWLDGKVERDIEENRKGQFVLNFTDAEGNPVKGRVKVRQVSHEFRFGCSLFYLDQFPDEERRKLYRERFKKVFNYAVVPLYWDTLEPCNGHPRFSKDSEYVYRRPPIDTIVDFCEENKIGMKGHCLVYNSFQPDWIPDDNRSIRILIDERIKKIAERYGNRIEDFDVINEMQTIYRNCYKGNGCRNLQITDDPDHEKWCFETSRRHFPNSRLFWNEGIEESFGKCYVGTRSFYYMTIEKMLSQGVNVQGIGMQYHAFEPDELLCNPLRIIDVLDCYGKFGLPIHISEISIPSFDNEPQNEENQAELTKRLFKLWFSQKHCESIVWWNLADNTAFQQESAYHAGLIREDCSEKPAYRAIDKLINEEWHTELETDTNGQLRFSGFYGDYEIEFISDGKKTTKTVRLYTDTTGYDNRLCDFRAKDICVAGN